MKPVFHFINRFSLVQQIIVGLILGVIVGFFFPLHVVQSIGIVGEFFIGALKAIAPLLIFVLIIAAISNYQKQESGGAMQKVVLLYVLGTFLAALVAVTVSFLFPIVVPLEVTSMEARGPADITEVLRTLFMNMVDNPVNALVSANYIGLISWGMLFGFALRSTNQSTRNLFQDLAQLVTSVIKKVILIAPLGVFGLVAVTIAETGFEGIKSYIQLVLVLLLAMGLVAFVVNPLLVYLLMRKNPYPLVFRCIKESGMTAFFTRSSAANIPVNIELSRKLGVREETYSVSIPLGATINMAGAAVTITIFTLAAVHTLGIEVDFLSALLLSIFATVGACGASGVAGGSLLLIPLACALFQIDNSIAMQLVVIGYVVGVIQDSTETALNSSTDVLFTAAADFAATGEEPNLKD
ncbi:serine/threonine transporter SstT [Ignatzschineria ureiclastica]|uniref:Serine/threonine transporter SstT n=1 Tax=Ignatzschineria ureiclastica TaxID=472582 RepID=A0A2U2ADV9_9GAMM|nr:serine/threonine transporter SstT [Ignatzschineria ureiclastica]PWD80846.1 serine/threonine transporter SstT [Ignatzschineria ureiclastica]GGZ94384.1 serine/threonine transporter SstT [Ignatzschineria ureiclastica]